MSPELQWGQVLDAAEEFARPRAKLVDAFCERLGCADIPGIIGSTKRLLVAGAMVMIARDDCGSPTLARFYEDDLRESLRSFETRWPRELVGPLLGFLEGVLMSHRENSVSVFVNEGKP